MAHSIMSSLLAECALLLTCSRAAAAAIADELHVRPEPAPSHRLVTS